MLSPSVYETTTKRSERSPRGKSTYTLVGRDPKLTLSTLSGFLRCSQRAMVDVLRVRQPSLLFAGFKLIY
jgi:hypothetical protein